MRCEVRRFIIQHYWRIERTISFIGAIGCGFLLLDCLIVAGVDVTNVRIIGWAVVPLMAVLKLCLLKENEARMHNFKPCCESSPARPSPHAG